MQHFIYGGSTAQRLISCPAWPRLSQEIPASVNEGSNPAADEGTMLHNCMEAIFDDESELDDLDFIKQMVKDAVEYKGQVLTQELADTKLIPALDAVYKVMKDYDIVDWMVEPLVKYSAEIGGSIDLLLISKDGQTVVVLDYKFGFHSVTVERNAQLSFYALCAVTDAKTAHYFNNDCRVVLAVVQPNEDGDDLETWEASLNYLDKFEDVYLDAVDRSKNPESQPVSGAHCKYCPAAAICPVKTGLALKASRINELTSDRLAEYLPMAAELEKWIVEVRKLALSQLELGTHIKGYKLVNKRASRVWNDQEAVEAKVRKAKKIKKEDAYDFKLKSVAQLQKVCEQKVVDFDKEYGQYVSSVSSGTTIAKESDKRPAALPVSGLAQLNAINE
tara:strand:+ start:1986 stop:3155 length:1170 start_codon:yes stop_codon:yes gene_type:complete